MADTVFADEVFESFFEEGDDGQRRELRVLRVPHELVSAFLVIDVWLNNYGYYEYFMDSENKDAHSIEFYAPLEYALMLNNRLIPNQANDLKLQWNVHPLFDETLNTTAMKYYLVCTPTSCQEIFRKLSPVELRNELLRLAKVVESVGATYGAQVKERVAKINSESAGDEH